MIGERAPKIVAAANVWRAGMPIPEDLRRYYQSPGDMPSSIDSDSLIAGVTNVPLLAVLAVDLRADRRCREDAVAQGLNVAGPTKFFSLIGERLDAAPEAPDPWSSRLLKNSYIRAEFG